MPRPLLWPLILALSCPAVAQGETSPAHDFTQQANQTCADLLFSRPEGVMKAARMAKMAALTLSMAGKPPDPNARDESAPAIDAEIKELRRMRTVLAALRAPVDLHEEWATLLGEVDFRIHLAENRRAILQGKATRPVLESDSPVRAADLERLAERLSSDWPDCEMALHADGPPEALRALYHQTNEACAALVTRQQSPEDRSDRDKVLAAFIAAREASLSLPDAELEAALKAQEQSARATATAFAALAASAPANLDGWAWIGNRLTLQADFHAERLRAVTGQPIDASSAFLAVDRPPLPDRRIEDTGLAITQCRNLAL